MREAQPRSLDFQDNFPEIKAQNDQCCLLRDQIEKFLEDYLGLSEDIKYAVTPSKTISHRLHYLENSFEFVEEKFTTENIDRGVSMFSGPLYCDHRYPQVRDDTGNPMFPILQIDLRWINKECQKSFPDGLLQLWIDTEWNKHVLRVIPWSEINVDQAVAFDWGDLHKTSSKRSKELSAPWPFDPNPRFLTGLTPVGMSCPNISRYLDFSEHEIPDDLVSAIDELESNSPSLGTHFFGDFYDPQADPGDFLPYKLFLTVVGWGAEGRAHIFYLPQADGKTLFKFAHSPR